MVGQHRQQVAAWTGSRCRGGRRPRRSARRVARRRDCRSSSGTSPNARARTGLAWVSGRRRAVGVEELGPPGGQRAGRRARGTGAASSSAPSSSADRGQRCRPTGAGTPWRRRTCPARRRPGSRSMLAPGSSHSPQWNPVSQRYCSCGSGVRPRAARGRGGGPRRPSAPRSRATPPSPATARASRSTVAVGLVEVPRHEHHRVAPAGRAVAAARAGRRSPRPAASGTCWRTQPSAHWSTAQVAQPLAREAGDVVEVGRGRGEDLPVTGPAGPLALRAVGGDVARRCRGSDHTDRLVQPVDAARRCTRTSRCAAGRCARRRRSRRRGRADPGGPRPGRTGSRGS